MKWLNDLVEASHSSLEVLPVPCLCEFLMAGYQDRTSGGGGADTGDSDSLSHRTHYKRKKSAKDKVRLCVAVCVSVCRVPESEYTLNYVKDRVSCSTI